MSKISNIAVTNSASSNDRILLLVNTSGTANLRTITTENLFTTIATTANTTVAGVIKVGNGLSINGNGFLYSTVGTANTTVAGVIKVGDGLAIDGNGFLTVDGPAGFSNGSDILVDTITIGNVTSYFTTLSVNQTTGAFTIHSAQDGGWINEWKMIHEDGVPRFYLPLNGSINNEDGSHYLTKAMSDIIPVTTEQSLGSPDLPWKHLYISNNTIYINGIPLTISSTNEVLVNGHATYSPMGSVTNNQLCFSKEIVASGNLKLSGNLLDGLERPLLNTNALDINTDGGTSVSVFSAYDLQFDGGSVSTIFGLYEAGLDGGCSYNNLISSQFLDGGSALVQ